MEGGTVTEPGVPELNLSWVTSTLAVGGRYPMEAAVHLARVHAVSHVVDVRVEACDDEHVLRTHGIQLLHLPTVDMEALSEPMLERGVAWVSPLLAQERRVYVHCEHGIGRSALLALCVMVDRGMAPLEALALAKARRPRVSPSPPQLEAFIAFAERWRQRHRPAWHTPRFDALADIAYSHLRGPTSAAP